MMQAKRENIFYISIIALLLVVLVGIAYYSSIISPMESTPVEGGFWTQARHHFGSFTTSVHTHVVSNFGLLLAQIIVILIFARMMAWLFNKMGQPSVIGEIIAGVVLGPSLLGAVFPEAYEALFPAYSLPNISLLSQFGLIFFMFVIGMELDLSEIKKNLKKSFIISHSGIVFPMVMGVILAVFLYEDYAGSGSTLLPFALFLGISLSVTAFPVLARIIQEQGQMNSHIGVISMASAANGDITAWCAVAIIMALAQSGSPISALFTVLFAVIYMAVMFLVLRPAMKIIGDFYTSKEILSKGMIAMVFLLLLVSSYITEILGLHALFGAFMAGVIMPDNMKFRHMMTEKVEDVSLSVFLPLFFVSSGLQTQIGLLNTPTHWIITLIIIIIAIVAKVGGTYVACRAVGETKRDSTYIGILMNTRGLMELIILSMGYQAGVLSDVIYAMLVLMTLGTTFITTPMLDLVKSLWRRQDQRKGRIDTLEQKFHILFSFGRTNTGVLMLNLIKSFFGHRKDQVEVTGIHITADNTLSPSQADIYRQQSFAPIHKEAKLLALPFTEHYEASDNPIGAILRANKEGGSDLLLVGANIDLSHDPDDVRTNEMREQFMRRFGTGVGNAAMLFGAAHLFADKTEVFIRGSHSSVGIVIDRGLNVPTQNILVVQDSLSPHHAAYVSLVDKLLEKGEIIDIHGQPSIIDGLQALNATQLTEELLQSYDLLVLPYDSWKSITAQQPEFIQYIPTTLLLHSRVMKNN